MAAMSASKVCYIDTKPYDDQKPGTSGLRKKVKVFQQPYYLANFVQCIFNAVNSDETNKIGEGPLLVSGDGRYWNKEAIHIIAEIAAANGVKRLWVGQHGWVSTPAASCIIRERENGTCRGGFILTASHNPGGPTQDFGIKYNCFRGEPAPEQITERVYEESKQVKQYRKVELPPMDLDNIGTVYSYNNGQLKVEIIDPVEDWMAMMRKIFNFKLIKTLVQSPKFSFVYDALHGIGGPYAKALFIKELGASEACLKHCDPLEDFGGLHPDPNLTYASELVETMKVKTPESADESTPAFGAAGDGDCDRNMILGRGWFVTPSDSVAIIAAYAKDCIPYFEKNGIKGVARSMPTSMALKRVAQALSIDHYEVPTGWKFFGNLMEADKCSICGEESFGTSSDHIREKDGLWAVLAWLSILAYRNKATENTPPAENSKLVTVQQINEEFWKTYGRNYYTRYDYENVDAVSANAVLDHVLSLKLEGLASNMDLSETTRGYLSEHPVSVIDVFNYEDPMDGSVSKNQGVRVLFKDGCRFVLRLSGTGSSGATIRLYLESYQSNPNKLAMQTGDAMEQLVAIALDMAKIEKFTLRNHPTVIT